LFCWVSLTNTTISKRQFIHGFQACFNICKRLILHYPPCSQRWPVAYLYTIRSYFPTSISGLCGQRCIFLGRAIWHGFSLHLLERETLERWDDIRVPSRGLARFSLHEKHDFSRYPYCREFLGKNNGLDNGSPSFRARLLRPYVSTNTLLESHQVKISTQI
jgi:hypothetical protein